MYHQLEPSYFLNCIFLLRGCKGPVGGSDCLKTDPDRGQLIVLHALKTLG